MFRVPSLAYRPAPKAFRATDESRNVQTLKMDNGDYIPR
jgi:hypothetical protein